MPKDKATILKISIPSPLNFAYFDTNGHIFKLKYFFSKLYSFTKGKNPKLRNNL